MNTVKLKQSTTRKDKTERNATVLCFRFSKPNVTKLLPRTKRTYGSTCTYVHTYVCYVCAYVLNGRAKSSYLHCVRVYHRLTCMV